MVTFISHSPEETAHIGASWASELGHGCVVGISGDLGAGKTSLVRGIAQGMGVTDRVLSPTFALVHEYRSGPLRLFHLDLYRLSGPKEIVAAGLEELLVQPPGVSIVEWFERWGEPRRVPRAGSEKAFIRRVNIETRDENSRRIVYEDFSP